jgi:regulator of cell morphogenesis and NO signaling
MKTLVDEKTTVREMVRRFPQVRQSLEEMGIDYCCGGDVSLQEAAASQGVSLDALLQALDEAAHSVTGPEFRDWSIASAAELLDHIVSTHHEFMRRELPRLGVLLDRVKQAHPAHRPMLERLEHEIGRAHV